LVSLPVRVWAEVKKSPRHDRYTLAKAQVALAVAILCYMPVRSQNLATLAFDEHLFLKEGPGAVSSLELPANEVFTALARQKAVTKPPSSEPFARHYAPPSGFGSPPIAIARVSSSVRKFLNIMSTAVR
jgi:hypothetical protein